MDELPPYSGADATCVKCGNVGATTSYRHASEPVPDPLHPDVLVRAAGQEQLGRRCMTCGYEWAEAVIPARQDQSQR